MVEWFRERKRDFSVEKMKKRWAVRRLWSALDSELWIWVMKKNKFFFQKLAKKNLSYPAAVCLCCLNLFIIYICTFVIIFILLEINFVWYAIVFEKFMDFRSVNRWTTEVLDLEENAAALWTSEALPLDWQTPCLKRRISECVPIIDLIRDHSSEYPCKPSSSWRDGFVR